MQESVPSPFYGKQGSQPWLNMTTQHMQQVQPLNPHQARAQFLGKALCECVRVCVTKCKKYTMLHHAIIKMSLGVFCPGLVSAFPMFGSSFFYIQSCSSASIQAPCILAVNLNGLHFLNKDTHVGHTDSHNHACKSKHPHSPACVKCYIVHISWPAGKIWHRGSWMCKAGI